MDIIGEKNWIHQEIDKVNDANFVKKLMHLLQFANSEYSENTTEYNAAIDDALENIKNGEFYSHSEAKILSKKWGRK
jgi:predicted transcriptional regulator